MVLALLGAFTWVISVMFTVFDVMILAGLTHYHSIKNSNRVKFRGGGKMLSLAMQASLALLILRYFSFSFRFLVLFTDDNSGCDVFGFFCEFSDFFLHRRLRFLKRQVKEAQALRKVNCFPIGIQLKA